jgi:histidinol-phosphate aminotransferase
MEQRGVLLKPLNDSRLGKGFMRVTTALPKDNERVLGILHELL